MDRSIFLATLAMLLLAATLLPACGTDPVTGGRKLRLISEDEEIAMGQEAAPQFEEEFGGKVSDATLQKYVNYLGKSIAAKSHRPNMPYEFAVLNSDVPNAFALPGGNVYITAGLMRRLNNERQLVGVLGHEIGHVVKGHSVDQMQNSMGAQVLIEVVASVLGGDSGEAAKAGGAVAANMVILKYSRTDEYEADALGIEYLNRAGYNPYGMVEVLELLDALSGGEDGGAMTEMLQTHPLPKNRIERAKQLVQEKYPDAKPDTKDPNVRQFLQMRRRLPAAQE